MNEEGVELEGAGGWGPQAGAGTQSTQEERARSAGRWDQVRGGGGLEGVAMSGGGGTQEHVNHHVNQKMLINGY